MREMLLSSWILTPTNCKVLNSKLHTRLKDDRFYLFLSVPIRVFSIQVNAANIAELFCFFPWK